MRANQILIRNGFSYLESPAPGDASDRRLPDPSYRPPATRVLTAKGAALRLELTALALAQASSPRGRKPQNRLPLRPNRGQAQPLGWIDLVGSTAQPRSDGRYGATAMDKRNKQLQTALATLEKAQLVNLPRRQASRGAYEDFVLLDERGGRTYGDPLDYAVPSTGEAVFHIPAEMITNGWIHVLEDTEIALLLMTACRLGSITDGEAVAIPSSVRLLHYGIGRDAFEAHRMLTQLGLLSVDEQARYNDGRAVDYTDEGAQLHRLRLLRPGFAQDGWSTMTATIESMLDRTRTA